MIPPNLDKIEVDRITEDDDPFVMYFLPSGFPDKVLVVSEDPYSGASCRLEPQEFVDSLMEEIRVLNDSNRN